MAIREIITPPNPILRRKAKKVTAYNAALKQLVEDMVETMRQAPGVGLAAPQVAVGLRVIVVEYAETREAEASEPPAEPAKPKLYRVINPEIVRASEEIVVGTEACLSLPGYTGDVPRRQAVTVKGFNLQGKPIKIKAEDWLARIFQHEIDHLDGVLFIDRATKIWKAESEARVKLPEASSV